jgi:hypothetical protein
MRPAAAHEEIEIGPFVRLLNMLYVKPYPSAVR